MKAISNAIKGVTYHNPQLGESLYELCRRATSRHIAGPDDILNQQVVYMINSEMHTPYAAKDACTCLKRRLQMDHPQKQYLAIILTSKVLQECHAAIGIHQGELLQEVAYILRTCRSSGPAAARTRQVAMDVLRHFGSGGVDAYRQARQQGGPPVGARMESVNRDPAAVAAERASLLDEIKRMCEQAGASTEILNELILNKEQAAATGGTAGDDGGDSIGLRKELLADAAELRKLFDLYMEQLASLTGADAEQAMKEALEAVDMLDNALTLEKDVDAELKDLKEKGELPATASTAAGNSSSAAAAAATDTAAAKMKSMNLIDLDDDVPPTAAPAAGAAADPFAPAAVGTAGPVDPFAPSVQPHPAAALDPFAPAAVPAGTTDSFASPTAPAAADPFAALAVAPSGQQPYQAQPAAAAAAADPFAEPAPWGAPVSGTPPAPVGMPLQLPQAPPSAGGASAVSAGGASASSIPQGGSAGVSAGGASASAALAAAVVPPTGMSAGGYMPQATGLGPYGAPGTPGYSGMPIQGMPAGYGYGMQPMQQMPSPYGMSPYGMPAATPMYSPQVTGNTYGQPAAGPYPPYPNPYAQQQPQQQVQMPLLPQQHQQQALGGFAAPPTSLPAVQSPPASDAAGALSPTNPFATGAPVPAAGGVVNPFGNVSAGGAAATVDQEWNTFFSDARTGVQAGK